MKDMRSLVGCLVLMTLCGCASLPRGAARDYLVQTVVPEVEFRQAELQDIVHFINHPTTETELERKTPFIVLLLPFDREVTLVTLSMRNASLLEILHCVAKLTDSDLYIRGNHVFLEPKNPTQIPPDVLEQMIDRHSNKEASNNPLHTYSRKAADVLP